jgi:hypothetical protein
MKLLVFAFSTFAIFNFSKSSIKYTNLKMIDSQPQKYEASICYKTRSGLDIIERALLITKNSLSFDLSSKGNSSVKTISKTRKAHCVGYANFYSAVVSKLFKQNGLNLYRVEHVRAGVCLFGIKITNLIPDKRFADHDVCRITNTSTGEVYIVDPSLSDVVGNVIVKN